MYFHDRTEAGQKLAMALLESEWYEDTAVLAVSAGGVVVGNEIAKALHAPMGLLMTETITMPGVSDNATIGLIDQDGHFTYNNMLPTGLLTEFLEEMHNYLEAQKMEKLHELTRATHGQGFIDPEQFRHHHVIVVSDGFRNSLAFEAAAEYLKPVEMKQLVAAAPNVSVPAVDRLHVLADKLEILDVLSNYLDTDHYFEDNDLPDVEVMMRDVMYRWGE